MYRCPSSRDMRVPAPQIDRSLLLAIPLFARMNAAQFDSVLAEASVRRYPLGQPVFEQGAPATAFYVLLSGRLKVTQVTTDGQQVIVRMVNPGDLFGIARALSRPDYPGTASAAEDSIALSWPMEIWDQFIGQHPAMAVNAMHTIGTRLQEAQTRIRELATEEVERRVAHTVLRLVQQSGKKEADGIRIGFPISRQDIAELAGTTLHTVSRILSAWEEAGLVIGGRQKLLVRDAHRLLLIADGEAEGHL
jgi:CRP/FNR family transcriptional regulator, nitrogen oxide reductase regulator